MAGPNNSANPGYLTPVTPLPLDGAAFDQFLQSVVAGISGLPGTNVIPRWQPEPPAQPARNVDWASVGVSRTIRQGFGYALFDPQGSGGNGSLTQTTWVLQEVACSFYGPNCVSYAELFKDGLNVGQNRDALTTQQVSVQDVGEPNRLPELTAMGWVDRADLTFTVNRAKDRTYAIFSIVSSTGTITTDTGILSSFDTTE
jgi:hypothetical protein